MSHPARDLTKRVKVEAKQNGFDFIGVTTPDPPLHIDVYTQWLDRGRHGEMAYLSTERALQRRSDPKLILPECKSILVLATNYLPNRIEEQQPGSARIASYALGEDYHDTLVQRMKPIVEFIEREMGTPVAHKLYTDTGPILERELAQRAGLGWIGKNTCLILPSAGSNFLLSEILLGIELEIDTPFPYDMCGKCRRCIDACPTDCILPDRTLEARRCISYLTIELKNAIPVDLRQSTGDWIFGCDICQQVCPWNLRFAKPTTDPAFQPRQYLEKPDIKSFLELTPEAFQINFAGSPLKRSKRRGILRNASVAAGNCGDLNYLNNLEKLMHHDPESLIRSHAAWAIGKLGGPKAKTILQEAISLEKDPDTLKEIQKALHGLM